MFSSGPPGGSKYEAKPRVDHFWLASRICFSESLIALTVGESRSGEYGCWKLLVAYADGVEHASDPAATWCSTWLSDDVIRLNKVRVVDADSVWRKRLLALGEELGALTLVQATTKVVDGSLNAGWAGSAGSHCMNDSVLAVA